MTGSLLCIQSHFGSPDRLFERARKRSNVLLVQQTDLTAERIAHARGMITTIHLDQDALMQQRRALEVMLSKGGRWFFNGHILRPLLRGLRFFEPVRPQTLTTLSLSKTVSHPVFHGIDRRDLMVRKGVAGFYGRGANPLPAGADVITGLGPKQVPVDWEWVLPSGGLMFSHAGNDLQSISDSQVVQDQLCENIMTWVMGGTG